MNHQPPPSAQDPYSQYQPPPPRKSKKALWIILAVIAVMILLCGGACGLIGKSIDDTVKDMAPSGAMAAPAGSSVRDGKFEFTVTSVERDVPSVGDNPYLAKTAQGTYVLVHVDVVNIADKPQTYFGDNQKLIDNQGHQYSNDTMAELNLNPPDTAAAEINPGNKLSVVIAFDVPSGTVPTAIEFHDSMFSGGARATLP